jgi:hypothetical protein
VWAGIAAMAAGMAFMGGHAALTRPLPPPSSSGDRYDYSFLAMTADGSPYRWDPCTPIRYQVDLRGQPRDALRDVLGAIALTTEASGLRFEYAGLVEGSSPREIVRYMKFTAPTAEGTLGWSPLLFTFASERELARIGGKDVIARAYPVVSIYDRDQIVSGMIVVNDDVVLGPGFASTRSLGPVLEHELGHILGLAHADQPFQLMFATPVTPRWNDGDRTGLRRLGSGSCLSPPPAFPDSSVMAI